jgi:hypothetical protein
MLQIFDILGLKDLDIKSAQGIEIALNDGRTVFDFSGGLGMLGLGHNHPQINAAKCLCHELRIIDCLKIAPLKTFEPLRMARLKRMMTAAAECGSIFHLWWHPHSFEAHTEANLDILDRLFRHYHTLRDRFGMRSRTMAEAAA